MINTKITITPKQLHLKSQQTLNIKLIIKRVLISTNHQIQKHDCSNIILKNGIGIITKNIVFKLSRQFQLSNSKVCFDVLGIKGKAITFLGNGTFDLLPYSSRTHNQLKCRIDRCKDIYSHLDLQLRFQEIIPQSPNKQFINENPKTLYTQSFQNQNILIARRQKIDKPTAYQISRRNYKQAQVTRDQFPTQRKDRDSSGSYKRRFNYGNSGISGYSSRLTTGDKLNNSKEVINERELNDSKSSSKVISNLNNNNYNKGSKHSPYPRITTPQPISNGQSPSMKTKLRKPQKYKQLQMDKKNKDKSFEKRQLSKDTYSSRVKNVHYKPQANRQKIQNKSMLQKVSINKNKDKGNNKGDQRTNRIKSQQQRQLKESQLLNYQKQHQNYSQQEQEQKERPSYNIKPNMTDIKNLSQDDKKNSSSSKYQDINDKLQQIEERLKKRDKDISSKQRSPRTLRDKTTIIGKQRQRSKDPNNNNNNISNSNSSYNNNPFSNTFSNNNYNTSKGFPFQKSVNQYTNSKEGGGFNVKLSDDDDNQHISVNNSINTNINNNNKQKNSTSNPATSFPSKIFQSKVQQYRQELQQQNQRTPRLHQIQNQNESLNDNLRKIQQRFQNIQMSKKILKNQNIDDNNNMNNQYGNSPNTSSSKVKHRHSKIKIYKMQDGKNFESDVEIFNPNNQQKTETKVQDKSANTTPYKEQKQRQRQRLQKDQQPQISRTTYKIMQQTQSKLINELQILKLEYEKSQQEKHKIKINFIKSQQEKQQLNKKCNKYEGQVNDLKKMITNFQQKQKIQQQKLQKSQQQKKKQENTTNNKESQKKAIKQMIQKYQIQIQELQNLNNSKQELIDKLTKLYQEDQQKARSSQELSSQYLIKLRAFEKQNQQLKENLIIVQKQMKQYQNANQSLKKEIKITQSKLLESNKSLLHPNQKKEDEVSEVSSQSHSYKISIGEQSAQQKKYKNQARQYKQKCINLQSQIRYKENQIKFLKIKMDTLQAQNQNIQNNANQISKRQSGQKFRQSQSEITHHLKQQNKAMKNQINDLRSQLHKLNQLLSGSNSKSLLQGSRLNQDNSAKLQILQKKVQAYQNEIKQKKMLFAQIINIIWAKGSQGLINQISAKINS